MPNPLPTLLVLCTQNCVLQSASLSDLFVMTTVMINDIEDTFDIISAVQENESTWVAILPDEATESDVRYLWNLIQGESFAKLPLMAIGREQKAASTFLPHILSQGVLGLRRWVLNDKVGLGRMMIFQRHHFLRLPLYNHLPRFISVLMRRHGVRVISAPVSFSGVVPKISDSLRDMGDIFGLLWLRERMFMPSLTASDAEGDLLMSLAEEGPASIHPLKSAPHKKARAPKQERE